MMKKHIVRIAVEDMHTPDKIHKIRVGMFSSEDGFGKGEGVHPALWF